VGVIYLWMELLVLGYIFKNLFMGLFIIYEFTSSVIYIYASSPRMKSDSKPILKNLEPRRISHRVSEPRQAQDVKSL
jgi:predicted membrane protein